MNTAEGQTPSKPSTQNRELFNIKGKMEMNAAESRTQNTIATVYQNILNLKEEMEMKTALEIKNVSNWLSQSLSVKSPIKLLGGLALGALLMTATALPINSIYADGPNRPLTVERVVNPAWIAGDDRTPRDFDEGTAQDQARVSEVNTELDPEAMDDLIRYAYASDLIRTESGTRGIEGLAGGPLGDPELFTTGVEQGCKVNPSAKAEVKTELDAEAMDDLIRYAFPSDLE